VQSDRSFTQRLPTYLLLSLPWGHKRVEVARDRGELHNESLHLQNIIRILKWRA
jgi:hypothetical protein